MSDEMSDAIDQEDEDAKVKKLVARNSAMKPLPNAAQRAASASASANASGAIHVFVHDENNRSSVKATSAGDIPFFLNSGLGMATP
jgi:hypothetical protein